MNILRETIEFVALFREIFALSLVILLICCADFIFRPKKIKPQKQDMPEWLNTVAKEVVEANKKELYEAHTACLEHVDSLELQIENRQRALQLLDGEEAERVNKEVLAYSNEMLRLI